MAAVSEPDIFGAGRFDARCRSFIWGFLEQAANAFDKKPSGPSKLRDLDIEGVGSSGTSSSPSPVRYAEPRGDMTRVWMESQYWTALVWWREYD